MAISSKPFHLGSTLKLLTFLTQTNISLLKVNNNPLLHAVLKRTFYDHFCAGENGPEVRAKINEITTMGFRGVILTYAREIVTDPSTNEEKGLGMTSLEKNDSEAIAQSDTDIEAWRLGVLETIDMVGKNDFLALK
jgi:hypothetical protein